MGSETIDLIPNGRHTAVTDENKEKYVSLICNHRMTTAIQEQTRAYLEGFHELVKPELVSIFNAKNWNFLYLVCQITICMIFKKIQNTNITNLLIHRLNGFGILCIL